MKIIHTLAMAAGMTMLAACGGNQAEDNAATTLEANTLVVDNIANTDMNMDLNTDMNMDSNMDMNDHSNMDMNADANSTNTL